MPAAFCEGNAIVNWWSVEPATALTVTPLMVPFGPVSVTCDGVKVAGLISSLKVNCTELRGEAPVPEPLGVAETT